MKFTRGFKASMMSITGSQKASFGISVHMADTSLDKDAQTNIHKPGVSDTPGL